VTFGGRPHPLAADAVERAIDRASGGRPIPGNSVKLLFDGPAAFDAMIELIRSAERWVHLDNYIFRADRTGHRFATVLAERAKAGVSVRVATDWLGSLGTPRRFWRSLEASGVAVGHFHRPAPFDLATMLIRNHRKLVVADGARAILGGFCIGDEWAGDSAKARLPWRDSAILVEGPAAIALDQAFAKTWEMAVAPLPAEELAASVPASGSASIRVLAGEPVRERAYRVTELLLATAHERVWITDAYLVAPRRLHRHLVEAASEGVDVRLLVPGSSDIPFVRNLTRFGYRELLASGIRIFEWTGPMLHAKTVVADGRWVRVGSSNLNHSSLLGNYELDVLVESADLAGQMEAQYRRDLDQSAEVVTRQLRIPKPIGRALPPALSIQDRGEPPHHRGLRERQGRSILAMRTLVAGARLAIFGPLAVGLAVVAVLFFAFPRVMGIIVSVVSVWLAIVSGAEALRRRHRPVERSR
jgi:cardiolipin synthase